MSYRAALCRAKDREIRRWAGRVVNTLTAVSERLEREANR